MACGILVPQPGIEPGSLAGQDMSPNHWTAWEFSLAFWICLLADFKKMYNEKDQKGNIWVTQQNRKKIFSEMLK